MLRNFSLTQHVQGYTLDSVTIKGLNISKVKDLSDHFCVFFGMSPHI